MEKQQAKTILSGYNGVLPLLPVFIPRRFGSAGKRLRLHPHDYFALGTERGSIKERWFSSIIAAQNGPLAPADEGMSYVKLPQGRETLKQFVALLGEELLGEATMARYGTWPMYSKFFDYENALFHHLHLSFEAAARVGRLGKPEAYYYPPQLNNYPGTAPYTYFGFSPEVTRQEIKARLKNYTAADTRITELSRAYRIELGTGWYTAPGVVHAPGSYLTYEPQWNSDVNSVYENVAAGEVYPYDMLVENCPAENKQDLDYVLNLMDWDKNIDPDYRTHYHRPPVLCVQGEGYRENWVVYANPYIAAKELSVEPGATVTVRDNTPYGCILVQGHGLFAGHPAEAACMLRYGQPSADEFFVSAAAAEKGIVIKNNSYEPLVMLKHFPHNPQVPELSAKGSGV